MMKKVIFFVASMLVSVLTTSAQLKVNSSGNVGIGSTLFNGSAKVTVGNNISGLSSLNNIGLASFKTNSASLYNCGLLGVSYSGSATAGRAYGVCGLAGNATTGYNYGVFGQLVGSTNGTGIYGSASSSVVAINGKYAGFFYGSTYVMGTLTATTVNTTSDIRLKENVVPLSEAYDNTLDNVLGMNVIEYTFKKMPIEETDDSLLQTGVALTEEVEEPVKHFGLSAQELLEIYPNLVTEGQDGYLSVNYIELVPVLIRAIQELKAEVNELKGGSVQKAPGMTGIGVTATANHGNVSQLRQNTPNPFKERTQIRFTLADDVQSAMVCICDMQGKMLKQIPVRQGQTNVSVEGYDLQAGIYLYSLVVNGQEVETKRMILTK